MIVPSPVVLADKTLAIVGNGPSGNNQGAIIDSMDFVIRMNMWRRVGPVNSGKKLSAIVGYRRRTTDFPLVHENQNWEFWCNIPEEAAGKVRVFEASWVRDMAMRRAVRFIKGPTCSQVNNYLRSIANKPNKDRCVMTAGLATIAMCLDLSPRALHLWGFDRIGDVPGRAGNGWGRVILTSREARLNTVHDFLAEKKILCDLVDNKIWCGDPCSISIHWHGRPAV